MLTSSKAHVLSVHGMAASEKSLQKWCTTLIKCLLPIPDPACPVLCSYRDLVLLPTQKGFCVCPEIQTLAGSFPVMILKQTAMKPGSPAPQLPQAPSVLVVRERAQRKIMFPSGHLFCNRDTAAQVRWIIHLSCFLQTYSQWP